MKRGFKTQAEWQAAKLRKKVKLQTTAPLPARRLAGHLGFMVSRPEGVGALPEDIAAWMSCSTCGWSACVVRGSGVALVLYNPAQSAARQESSLMHELAHVLCGHEGTDIDLSGGLSLRKYSQEQEDEAAWLGGCLQLPRAALRYYLIRGYTPEQVADRFTASLDMVRYRYNITGLRYEIRRRAPGWN